MSKFEWSAEWHKQLQSFRTLFVGFSGGVDSTVLLHRLAQVPALLPRLIAIHVHHGLSQHADTWQQHCEAFCQTLGVTLRVAHVQCKQTANQEAAARAARYQAFDEQLHAQDALVLAHHRDDQAETVLLHLARGAGLTGLGAMHQRMQRKHYTVLRPFLTLSKQCLRQYATQHQLAWVEDDSNQILSYRRNYLRQDVLPRLAVHWPNIQSQLAQVAICSQQACANLFDLACMDYPGLASETASLALSVLHTLPQPRLRNVLWYWLKQKHVIPLTHDVIEQIASTLVESSPAGGKRIQMAHHAIWCHKQCLYVTPVEYVQSVAQPILWEDVTLPLTLPQPLGTLIATQQNSASPWCAPLEIRFRVGGETMRLNGQTKSLKKCYQAWSIPPWQRQQIPLIYAHGELVQVMGYAVQDAFKTQLSVVWGESQDVE